MASLTLRLGKGSPLTNLEIDNNFSNLNSDIQTRLETPVSNGIAVSLGSNDSIARSLAASGVGLSVTNADGVDGNPTIVSNATALNTASTIVSRDASGNFAAGALTITSASASGTISAATLSATNIGGTTITATEFQGSLHVTTGGTIIYEGSVNDAFETTLSVVNPTADRTITFPDVTGNVVTTGDTGTVTNTMLAGSIANNKLVNSGITIEGQLIQLGASGSISSSNISWTGTQTFRDNAFAIIDNVDATKILNLQLSGITTGTTRTLSVPDETGTIATQTYVVGQLNALVAPGIVTFFAMATAPSGWLKCNGAEVSRTTYANLFAEIGTVFGAGDGSTTFNLPDLRGEFIRGFDDGKGTDTGRVFGSLQAQQTDAITSAESATTTAVTSMTIPSDGSWSSYLSTGSGTGRGIRLKRSAVDNRPRNVALLPCIKY